MRVIIKAFSKYSGASQPGAFISIVDGEYVFRLCSTTGNRGPPCSWMKDAKETPASYNKNTRPAWFSEEVTSFRGYGDIKYAGQMTRDHQYNVY